MERFLVQGCGVSLICEKGDTMLGWIEYIVRCGGVPKVQRLAQERL